MKHHLILEYKKSFKASNLVIVLIFLWQTYGVIGMEMSFKFDMNDQLFILNNIIFGNIIPAVFLCVSLLVALSVSTEIKENSYSAQLVSGLSRTDYNMYKVLYYFFLGIILFVIFVIPLLVFYSDKINYIELIQAINLLQFIDVLVALMAAVITGFIFGQLLSPLLSLGLIVLIFLFEWLISFMFILFELVKLSKFLPVQFLRSQSDSILELLIKICILIVLGILNINISNRKYV